METALDEKLKVQIEIQDKLKSASPFVNTYKYKVETLSVLRIGDLDSKIVENQKRRFDAFFAIA